MESNSGKGTTFRIRLPLERLKTLAEAASSAIINYR